MSRFSTLFFHLLNCLNFMTLLQRLFKTIKNRSEMTNCNAQFQLAIAVQLNWVSLIINYFQTRPTVKVFFQQPLLGFAPNSKLKLSETPLCYFLKITWPIWLNTNNLNSFTNLTNLTELNSTCTELASVQPQLVL